MKTWSRDFTVKEKILLLLLVVILLGLVYYWFVDQPVRTSIAAAEAECESLRVELETVRLQVSKMEEMESELDSIEGSGIRSYMGSYNNSEAELALLNDVLATTLQYTISFSDVTRDGDQIRRNFTLQFKAANYDATRDILSKLSGGMYRCLIGDIRCVAGNEKDSTVTVNASATFFETMVGGTPDAGLPQDTAEAY